jgi:hypothetical protein
MDDQSTVFTKEKDGLDNNNDTNTTTTNTKPPTKYLIVAHTESNDPKDAIPTASGRQVPETADNMAKERPAKPNPTRGGEKEGDLTLYSPIG